MVKHKGKSKAWVNNDGVFEYDTDMESIKTKVEEIMAAWVEKRSQPAEWFPYPGGNFSTQNLVASSTVEDIDVLRDMARTTLAAEDTSTFGGTAVDSLMNSQFSGSQVADTNAIPVLRIVAKNVRGLKTDERIHELITELKQQKHGTSLS